MSNAESMRRNIASMVQELRSSLQEIGDNNDIPGTNVVADSRDRLRYITSLTEQAARRTLQSVEAIQERLHNQQNEAASLMGKTRSPEIRAFLQRIQEEHRQSSADATEIMQAQEFEDLVGQVVNKMLVTVEKMEKSLVHLLVEADPKNEKLSGPAIHDQDRVSQDDVDSLFD